MCSYFNWTTLGQIYLQLRSVHIYIIYLATVSNRTKCWKYRSKINSAHKWKLQNEKKAKWIEKRTDMWHRNAVHSKLFLTRDAFKTQFNCNHGRDWARNGLPHKMWNDEVILCGTLQFSSQTNRKKVTFHSNLI